MLTVFSFYLPKRGFGHFCHAGMTLFEFLLHRHNTFRFKPFFLIFQKIMRDEQLISWHTAFGWPLHPIIIFFNLHCCEVLTSFAHKCTSVLMFLLCMHNTFFLHFFIIKFFIINKRTPKI